MDESAGGHTIDGDWLLCNQAVVKCKGKTIKAYIDRHRSFCWLSIQWRLEMLSFRQLCVAAVPYGVTTNDPTRQKVACRIHLQRSNSFFSTLRLLQETKKRCNQYTVSRTHKRQAAPALEASLAAATRCMCIANGAICPQ
jgi:hypothetical protein